MYLACIFLKFFSSNGWFSPMNFFVNIIPCVFHLFSQVSFLILKSSDFKFMKTLIGLMLRHLVWWQRLTPVLFWKPDSFIAAFLIFSWHVCHWSFWFFWFLVSDMLVVYAVLFNFGVVGLCPSINHQTQLELFKKPLD